MREVFDLSHYIHTVGNFGQNQTLGVIPTLPGDSFDIDYQATVRLASLRRSLTTDAVVDTFAFWEPHRHSYDGDGTDNLFLKMFTEGVTTNVALPGITLGKPHSCLGQRELQGLLPAWRVKPYDNIFNWFFKHPTDDNIYLVDPPTGKTATTSLKRRLFGQNCCHLKRLWNTGLDKTKSKALGNDIYGASVSNNEAAVDVWGLKEEAAKYNNLAQRDWFSVRYHDLLKSQFGSSVNIDVENRPRLLKRETHYLSGYDIDGTADGNMGQVASKAFGNVRLRIPRVFIPEHGSIWLMMLVRFPCIHVDETHYLNKKPSPTYEEFMGDAAIVSQQKPHELLSKELFQSSSSNQTLGLQPYGQWYRQHPDVVHKLYDSLNGFPFLDRYPASLADAHYSTAKDYDVVFQSPSMLGHWQSAAHCNVAVHRVYNNARANLFVD